MTNILSNETAKKDIIVFRTPNLKEGDSLYTIKSGEVYKIVSESYYNADISKNITNIMYLPAEHIIGDGLFGFIETIPTEPVACKLINSNTDTK
jgi:hypothetical protein